MAADTFPESAAPATRRAETDTTSAPPEAEALGISTHTFSGAFDAAFDLYKRHFSTLALIVAYVFIPTQVVLYAAGNVWFRPIAAQINSANPDAGKLMQAIFIGWLLGSPGNGVPGYLSLMTSFMVSGPVAVAVGNILIGRPVRVSGAYRRAAPVLRRLFFTWILLFLVFFVACFVAVFAISMVFIMISAAAAMSPWGNSFVSTSEAGLVILIVMVVVSYLAGCMSTAYFFAYSPALIGLENLKVLAAVERNMQLMRGKRFWRAAVSVALLPLVTFGLQVLTLASASSTVQTLKWPAWAEFVINTGLSSVIAFFFQPYWMIFLTLLYFDARVRSEGLDLRYLADNQPELDPYLEPPPPHNAPGSPAGMPPPFPTAAPPYPYPGPPPQ